MVLRIWLLLIFVFGLYTWWVYINCDKNNQEGRPGKEVITGWGIWQEKNCQSCHQIYGLGGYMGPDLTNIYSDPTKGAGYMRAFIPHGTQRMPDFNLSDTETSRLISFLAWVDKSGNNKVGKQEVKWYGNYKRLGK